RLVACPAARGERCAREGEVMIMRFGWGTVAAAAAGMAMLLSGLAPAAFGAANRYASPGGSGSACTQIAPCAIDVAINGANSGDDITLLGGVPPAAPYSHSGSSELGQGCAPGGPPITNITLRGAPGARAVIDVSNT